VYTINSTLIIHSSKILQQLLQLSSAKKCKSGHTANKSNNKYCKRKTQNWILQNIVELYNIQKHYMITTLANIVSAVMVGGLFLWPALQYGTGYQTVWEIQPSAETHSSVHWRRFYFQLTCVRSALELFGRCALQIYLLTYLLTIGPMQDVLVKTFKVQNLVPFNTCSMFSEECSLLASNKNTPRDTRL